MRQTVPIPTGTASLLDLFPGKYERSASGASSNRHLPFVLESLSVSRPASPYRKGIVSANMDGRRRDGPFGLRLTRAFLAVDPHFRERWEFQH